MIISKPLRIMFWLLLIPALAILAVVISTDAFIRLFIILGIVGVVLGFIILQKPYIGIAATLASLVIVDTLPSLSSISSVTGVLGGITLIAYFLQSRRRVNDEEKRSLNPGLLLLMLLILWIFFSNPGAALLGEERIWLFTLIQLWILAWLGGQLVDEPSKSSWIFIIFIIVSDISAVVSIRTGIIGPTLSESIRSGGLMGINTASRYYVLSLLFLYFIYTTKTNQRIWVTLFSIGSSIILILGLAYTLSRSGFVLLPVLVGLILFQPNFKFKQKWLFLLLGIGITLVFVPEYVFNFAGLKILPSILEGTDTMGLRYKIWEGGLKMFLAHPITGVGIGQFSNNLPIYASGIIPSYYLPWITSHSIYIQVLSETGMIGTLIFLSTIIFAFVSAFKKVYSSQNRNTFTDWIWLSVLVIILIGGITKSDFADKFLWIALGIAFQSSRNKTSLQISRVTS